jgi:endonuclease YncB( thermonuclease family)
VITLPPVPAPFILNAWVIEWHDGDTVICRVDRADRDYSEWPVRLLNTACLELSEPGGPETQAEVTRRWPPGTRLVLLTARPDKFGGRKLARVIAAEPDGSSVDVSVALIAAGWALPWNGKGPQPKPPWPRPEDLPTGGPDTGNPAPPL